MVLDSGATVIRRFSTLFHLPVLSCVGRFLEKRPNGASLDSHGAPLS
jgi:hypothetical protein